MEAYREPRVIASVMGLSQSWCLKYSQRWPMGWCESCAIGPFSPRCTTYMSISSRGIPAHLNARMHYNWRAQKQSGLTPIHVREITQKWTKTTCTLPSWWNFQNCEFSAAHKMHFKHIFKFRGANLTFVDWHWSNWECQWLKEKWRSRDQSGHCSGHRGQGSEMENLTAESSH